MHLFIPASNFLFSFLFFSVWQHIDCMGVRDNIPESYFCEKCEPRQVDIEKAKLIQTRKLEELTGRTFQLTSF